MRNAICLTISGLVLCLLGFGCNDSPTECCEPTITNVPQDAVGVFIGEHYTHQFAVANIGNETVAEWSVTVVGDPPSGVYAIDSSGVFTFTSAAADVEKSFTFRVTAGVATASFSVTVENREPLKIDLTGDWAMLGYAAEVPLEKLNASDAIGSFTIVIAYPAQAMELVSVEPGALVTNANWERFDYSYAGQGLSPDGKLLKYVRITAAADDPLTTGGPSSFLRESGRLALINFMIAEDTSLICGLPSVDFVWLDCGDNAFRTRSSDTLLISHDVYPWSGPALSDTCTVFEPGTLCGAGPECEESSSGTTIRFVDFSGGVVQLDCDYEIDRPGDINLNGIDNEIADMLLYSRYFLQSDSVFTINKVKQIEEADINRDGYYLTVGDMTYLTRIIVGDAQPHTQLQPFAKSATFSFVDGTLNSESDVQIGSIWARFEVSGDYSVDNLTDMEAQSNLQDGILNVLVWSGATNMLSSIPSGSNDLFSISGGEAELIYLEASSYDGSMMSMAVYGADGVRTFAPRRANP